MSCEKASRRLRCIMMKAKRFGITEYELADLSGTKKITNLKSYTNTWSIIAVIIILAIGGTLVLAIVCNPCCSEQRHTKRINETAGHRLQACMQDIAEGSFEENRRKGTREAAAISTRPFGSRYKRPLFRRVTLTLDCIMTIRFTWPRQSNAQLPPYRTSIPAQKSRTFRHDTHDTQ
ncbi:hypothetical protein PV325_002924 [Microctonus aethiopoides]|nr:hypothetical protein PV325_002924 [Microctonus aethiopoides]